MDKLTRLLALLALLAGLLGASLSFADDDDDDDGRKGKGKGKSAAVQLGPRPFYLIDEMTPSKLKRKLESCENGPFYRSDFSIGHRGAPLLFPEHTEESYRAAAKMGAGILECDVTFTGDGALVCRHAQCDLHTTTNILSTPLAGTCEVPFTPATFDPVTGERLTAATARCCTSALTRNQFLSLCGKMDAADPNATNVEAYQTGQGATAVFRTDLYATCGTLLTHEQSIELFDDLGTGYTPELKGGRAEDIAAVFGSQAAYAEAMIDEYADARIRPRKVWAQSFNYDDVLHWIDNSRYGDQAVWLDSRPYTEPGFEPSLADFEARYARGLRVIAPPMFALLTTNSYGRIVPSRYARLARRAGLEIITWTTERSGRVLEDMKNGSGGTFYYQTTLDAVNNDGAIMETLDVLAKKVKIIGIFSDWPATTTYYANCMNID